MVSDSPARHDQSAPAALPATRSPLLPAIAIGLAVVLIGMLYWEILADMARDWWNEDALSHGMLLPPLAAYIAWLNRETTLRLPVSPAWSGLLVILLACLTLLTGKLASEFFMARFSFVILVAGLILTFWGKARMRSLALPLLLLAAMVPLPSVVYNRLAAPLQLLTSEISTHIAQFLGVSLYRDGNIIQLAGTTLGVAEACSGLNSLSALMVGGILLGFLLCTSILSRVLLFLSSLPFAVAVNIVRVAGTAVAADYDQKFANGFYHSFSGWLVFVAGFGLLYLFARLLHAFIDPRISANAPHA
ncbi:MAG: exosortase/archaeosortase family protein [Bryobacteraceae bacterium]|nr:exosortase/archaeosortase family protein [Bryobacteraceae bacterium]